MLLSGLRESVESLTGELTAIDERLRANAECAAGAEKTIAEREAEAAALRESAERVLSGQSELLAESGRLAENVTAPLICGSWRRTCRETGNKRRQR